MKKRIFVLLIILIFLLGAGMILYPSVGNFITLSTSSMTIADYEEAVSASSLSPSAAERLYLAQQFNRDLYYGQNILGQDRCLCVNGDVIGYLNIPKISVYLPIFYGTSSEVLRQGCGYIKNTSLPVGGTSTNTGICGHTGLPGAVLLSDLDQMEVGDYFYLHVLGMVLAYEVETISVVLPDDAELLRIKPGRDLATLVTCTPYGVNTHRLIVQGRRTAYVEDEFGYPASSRAVSEGLSDALRRQLILIGILVLFFLALLIAGVIYSRRKAKKAAKATQDFVKE